jgi:RNA polymerase sigma-70 factor (ECF subfamily)
VHPDRSINEFLLLQQLAEGDRKAFRALYDLHRDKLFFYTLRLTESKQVAEDVLQEVFIKVWQQRENLKEIRSFDAWLFTLAKNQVINGFKRASLERTIIAGMKDAATESSDPVTQSINYRETNRFLQEAINQLPPQQKKIYHLRQEQGMKTREIAHQLNISPLTVKKHVAQAVRSIRLLLEKQTGLTGALIVGLFKWLNLL